MNRVVSNYSSKESVLYAVTDMACENCLSAINKFATLKKKYTPQWVQDLQKTKEAARLMPNEDARQGELSAKGKSVADANAVVCTNFLLLMQYLKDGFAQNVVANMRKVAGAGYYSAASRGNWRATTTLGGMMVSFMAAYPTELAAGEMPDGFAETAGSAVNKFGEMLKLFNDYKNTAEKESADKVTANNAVYARLQGMLADGKVIFKKEATLQKQFSYAALAKKVAGGTKTGYRLALKMETSQLPVATATLTAQPGNYSFTADKKGIVLAELPQGTYNFVVTAPDCAPVTGVMKTHTGVMHQMKWVLKHAAAAPTMVVKEEAMVGG